MQLLYKEKHARHHSINTVGNSVPQTLFTIGVESNVDTAPLASAVTIGNSLPQITFNLGN